MDVDGLLEPTSEIMRKAGIRAAKKLGAEKDWLKDAAKACRSLPNHRDVLSEL